MNFTEAIASLWTESGIYQIIGNVSVSWQNLVMIIIACVLLYLAIVRQFEPLLLLGIAFGMLLANIPLSGMIHMDLYAELPIPFGRVLHEGGMLDILYLGVKLGIYPCLIFMGIGAMTDFGPLLSNPASMLLGAAAQFGIFCAFIVANILGFTPQESGAISIIGGADGPTAIYLATKLAPHLLPAIAIAAYSYMALIPLIQPPIMRALTTREEREVKMTQLRDVSKVEKILFPIAVTILCCLILPSITPLIGMFMLGNLFRECGIVERLSDTAQNTLINIVTIFLSLTVGATAVGETFLQPETLKIIFLGLFAFCFSTVGGLLFGKVLHWISGGKINPLIGSAGVSAVPMAARVSQIEGQRANPGNFLLMHAMGPNVAGVIGSAVAAGFLLSLLGK